MRHAAPRLTPRSSSGRPNRAARVLTAVAGLALLTASCGGGNDTASPSTTEAPPETTTLAATTVAPATTAAPETTTVQTVPAPNNDPTNPPLPDSLFADYFVLSSPGIPGPGIPHEVSAELAELESVVAVSALRSSLVGLDAVVTVKTDGQELTIEPTITAIVGDQLPALHDPGFVAGGPENLAQDGILIHTDVAAKLGLEVGDTLDFEFPAEGARSLEVMGVFEDAVILDDWVMDISTYEQVFPRTPQLDFAVFAKLADGVDWNDPPADIQALVDLHPQLRFGGRELFD